MATVIMSTLLILAFAVVMIVAAYFDRRRARQIEHDLYQGIEHWHEGPTRRRNA